MGKLLKNSTVEKEEAKITCLTKTNKKEIICNELEISVMAYWKSDIAGRTFLQAMQIWK